MKKSMCVALAAVICVLSGCGNDEKPHTTPEKNETCSGVNVKTDINNCGTCGHVCQAGEQCVGGTCTVVSEACAGIDLNTDNENCGTCGNACLEGMQCVSGQCRPACEGVDLNTDSKNCGTCGKPCGSTSHCVGGKCIESGECTSENMLSDNHNCGYCGHECGSHTTCEQGICVCESGFFDCDGNGTCETEGECECRPGDTERCYTGPANTENVGECHGGYYACVVNEEIGAFIDYNTCIGQVLPSYDYVCDANRPNLDMDCNGIPEMKQDGDGDSYPICGSKGELVDCCDNERMCRTTRPDLVYPGKAYDCYGNEIDDNCNGVTDEDVDKACDDGTTCLPDEPNCTVSCEKIPGTCSSTNDYKFTARDEKADMRGAALALVNAMDVCVEHVTEESGKPGLIEYSLTQIGSSNSSSGASVYNGQVNVVEGMYGAHDAKIKPREGTTFAMLSTGYAIDANDGASNDKAWDSDGFVDENSDLAAIPEPYSSAHNGRLETHLACFTHSENSQLYDTVHLHLKLRAPESVFSLKFDFRFFTQEYPAFVCSDYNDFFIALLTDETGRPLVKDSLDGNISFDEAGNPISVNNAFFTTCAPYQCGIGGKCKANMTCNPDTNECIECRNGYEELYAYTKTPFTGTESNGSKYHPEASDWADDLQDVKGGATAWLRTEAPVKPGEVFNLDFYIWDTGDPRYDSTVILDNFQWGCDSSVTRAGTDFAPMQEVIQ